MSQMRMPETEVSHGECGWAVCRDEDAKLLTLVTTRDSLSMDPAVFGRANDRLGAAATPLALLLTAIRSAPPVPTLGSTVS